MAGVDKEQLDIAAKLKTLMDAMASAAARIDSSTASQVDSMKQLAESIGDMNMRETITQINGVSGGFNDLIQTMSELTKVQQQTLDEMAKKAAAAGGTVNKLTTELSATQKALNNVNATSLEQLMTALSEPGGVTVLLNNKLTKLGKYLNKEFPVSSAVALAGLTGLFQGMKNIVAMGSSTLSFFGGLGDSIVNIGGAILAIPFKMFNGLIDIANKAGGGSNELAQAIENIRKEFGALNQTGPKTIMKMSTELKGFAATGLSAWRIFGPLHKRLEDFLKLSQEMGPTFENFAQEFQEQGGALLAYQKGLGLSGEDMGTIGKQALMMGTTMEKPLEAIRKQAQDLGETFGIASKHISRDMVKAMGDVAHFAGATVKEIGQASVYARKLGVELDKLVGTLDAFETFDSAADNASKLSQAFGLNVDAFKMMEAQDPAKQIEMLRKQMAAAGQDASTMNRQQIKLLATSTGLDAATAKQVFSMKNQGVGLDDIKKKSEAAEKKQLSQADAMKKLADSIERLVQSGGGQQGGFFERFFHGFLGGVQASKGFRDIIMNINKALRVTEMAGVTLGKAFAKLPGVQEFFGAIADMFKPGKFDALFNGFSADLQKFFQDVTTGKHSFGELMKALQARFFNFFDKEKGPGKKLVESFKKIFKVVSTIVSEGIVWAAEQMRGALVDLNVLIKDFASGKFSSAGDGAGKGALGFIMPIVKALGKAWELLSPVLLTLAITVGKLLAKFFEEKVIPAVLPFLPHLALALFGPAVMRSVLAYATTALGKVMLKAITAAFTGPATEVAASGGAKGLGSIMSKAFSGIGKFLGPVAIAVAIADAAVNVNTAMKKFETDLAPVFGATEAKMGAAGVGIINALTFGLISDDTQKKIAEAIAGLSGSLFKVVEGYFGATFTQKLKNYIASALNLFSSIGALIKELFDGNSDSIADALIDVGKKTLVFIGSMFLWMAEEIPTILVKVLAFGTKLLSSFWKVLSKLFEKGEKIPVVGVLFEALSAYTGAVGAVIAKISDLLSGLGALFKESGVLGTIGNAFHKIFGSSKDVQAAGTAAVVAVDKGMAALPATVTDRVNEAATAAASAPAPSQAFEGLGKGLVDGVDKGMAGLPKGMETLSTTVTHKVNEAAAAAAKASNTNKAFEDIGASAVAGLGKGMAGMPKVMAQKVNEAAVDAKRDASANVASIAVPQLPDNNSASVIASVQNNMQQVSDALDSPGAQSVSGKKKQISVLKDTFTVLSDLMKSAASFTNDMAATTAGIKTDALEPAFQAVANMVKATQQLDDILSKLPKIDIKAKLGVLAKSAGLGGKAVYTVQSKAVNITVNMTVTMNAADLEKALVLRESSIIRNRINFATSEPNKEGIDQLPENSSVGFAPKLTGK